MYNLAALWTTVFSHWAPGRQVCMWTPSGIPPCCKSLSQGRGSHHTVSLFLLPISQWSLCCFLCRSCSISPHLFLRRSCSICRCRFNASTGGVEFRVYLGCHLGPLSNLNFYRSHSWLLLNIHSWNYILLFCVYVFYITNIMSSFLLDKFLPTQWLCWISFCNCMVMDNSFFFLPLKTMFQCTTGFPQMQTLKQGLKCR